MPWATIFVDHVGDTSDSGGLRFLITGRYVDGTLGGFQALTKCALRASVCEAAQRTGRPLMVLWKDGRAGKWIVDVDLLKVSA